MSKKYYYDKNNKKHYYNEENNNNDINDDEEDYQSDDQDEEESGDDENSITEDDESEDEGSEDEVSEDELDNNETLDDKHIMISYNWESRPICIRIKNELQKLNYKVWMDVDQIHGSANESMAEAVENSWCVLMCMTEKYAASFNCKKEAEYADLKKKIILPLMLQNDYQPQGW